MATLSGASASTTLRLRRFAAPAAAVTLMLLWGGLIYVSGGRDDAHITYWAARTLARQGAILNYNLDRVEQSSSLLHVLLLAGLTRATGLALPDLGLALSIAGGIVAVVGAWLLARRLDPGRAWIAPLLLVAVPYLPYWSFGQLEASLAAALMSLLPVALDDSLDERRRPGSDTALIALSAAYTLIRPEGGLVLLTGTGLAAAGLWWCRRRSASETPPPWRRPAARIGIATALSLAAVTLWRSWYFGRLVPQPVSAKAGGLRLDTLSEGVVYLLRSVSWLPTMLALAILLALGLAGAWQARGPGAERRRVTLVFIAALVCAQLGFTIATGGDWMEGARFLVPVLPLLAAGAVAGLARWPRRHAGTATALILALGLAQTLTFTAASSTGTPLWGALRQRGEVRQALRGEQPWVSWPEWANRVNLRDVPLVVALDPWIRALLRSTGQPRLTVLSGQMGMVPYHLAGRFPGALRLIDLRGLVTRDLTDCRLTADRRRGRGGLAGLSYGRALRMRGALASVCAIAEPDLVFGPSTPGRLAEVAAAGYAIVYRQEGAIDAAQGLGAARSIDAFIAVRRHLLTRALTGLPTSLRLGTGPGPDDRMPDGRLPDDG